MGWLRKRFGEASTHSGLGLLLMGAGMIWPQHQLLLQGIGASLGVTAIAIPEARR